jgi:hypothetical protein
LFIATTRPERGAGAGMLIENFMFLFTRCDSYAPSEKNGRRVVCPSGRLPMSVFSVAA